MDECADLGGCGRRKFRLEDVRLWSTSLHNVLCCADGRDEFREFLDKGDHIEKLRTLRFWEECKEILGKCDQLTTSKSTAGSYNSDALSALSGKVSALVREYLDESEIYPINLEPALIRELNNCVILENPDEIAKSFKNAKSTAQDLLRDLYSIFAKELVKECSVAKE